MELGNILVISYPENYFVEIHSDSVHIGTPYSELDINL